jgi:hypothetical protein
MRLRLWGMHPKTGICSMCHTFFCSFLSIENKKVMKKNQKGQKVIREPRKSTKTFSLLFFNLMFFSLSFELIGLQDIFKVYFILVVDKRGEKRRKQKKKERRKEREHNRKRKKKKEKGKKINLLHCFCTVLINEKKSHLQEEEEDALLLIRNSDNTNAPPTFPLSLPQHPHRQNKEERKKKHLCERKRIVLLFPSLFHLPFIFISSTQKMINKI